MATPPASKRGPGALDPSEDFISRGYGSKNVQILPSLARGYGSKNAQILTSLASGYGSKNE